MADQNLQPDRIKVGAGVILVSMCGLARDWGVPEKGIEALLGTFQIPLIKFPGGTKRYVSLWALEAALFEAGLPQAAYGSQEVIRAIHEAAAIIYATASKEVVRERVRLLADDLKKAAGQPVRKPRKQRGVKSRPWRESQA